MYISENYKDVKRVNATWTFENSTVFTIYPKDQKINLDRRKVTADSQRKFKDVIYLSFESSLEFAEFEV